MVPRAWTLDVAAMLERELPDEIPVAWLDAVGVLTDARLPSHLTDRPAPALPAARDAAIAQEVDEVIARIHVEVFPLHGIIDAERASEHEM